MIVTCVREPISFVKVKYIYTGN